MPGASARGGRGAPLARDRGRAERLAGAAHQSATLLLGRATCPMRRADSQRVPPSPPRLSPVKLPRGCRWLRPLRTVGPAGRTLFPSEKGNGECALRARRRARRACHPAGLRPPVAPPLGRAPRAALQGGGVRRPRPRAHVRRDRGQSRLGSRGSRPVGQADPCPVPPF